MMFMKATLTILIICVAVFIAQVAAPKVDYREKFDELNGLEEAILFSVVTTTFALIPVDALSGNYWQFFTYMFLHGDIMHLFINMFVLVIFGSIIEKTLGTKTYIYLFIISGLGSGFLYILLSYIFSTSSFIWPMLGASGAIFGIMAAYGILFPKNWIIMFPGIPMPASVAVIVFAGVEFFFGVTGLQSGVANFGHLGGLVFGVIFIFAWKKWKKIKEESELGKWEFFWE